MPSHRKKKSPAAQRPARGALMTAVIIAAIASNASKPGRKSDPKTLAAVELVSQYFELIVIIIIIPCKLLTPVSVRVVHWFRIIGARGYRSSRGYLLDP